MSTTATLPEAQVLERLEELGPLAGGVARRWAGRGMGWGGLGADDLAQEAAIAMWRTLRERPGVPVSFLAQVAGHAARAALKRGRSVDRPLARERRRPWEVVSLEALQEDEAGWQALEGRLSRRRHGGEVSRPTEEAALARVLYQELWRVLTPRQRQVLALRLAGLFERESVAALGLSAVSNVHRALDAIRRKLMALLDDGPTLPIEPDPAFATAEEAALELGLSRVRVAHLCQEGRVQGARLVERPDGRGMVWLIPRPVVRA